MIEKWELSHFPFDKDPLRHKARVRGTEEDLKDLISKLPAECGKPFVTLSQDYDWAFYIYKLDDALRLKAAEILKGFSPNGSVVEPAALQVGKELPPMLEDVLEAAAKNLLKPAEESVFTSLNPSCSFASFIVGPGSRFTHAAAQAVAENPGKIYNPFFIYGGVGVGKTHLMQAIGHFILSKNPQAQVAFISTEKFTSLVIKAVRQGALSRLREQFRRLDALLIDDIHFLAGSESAQKEFLKVFNDLHQLGKQIVITSDRPPKQIPTLEDQLRSRFEWGLTTDLKPPEKVVTKEEKKEVKKEEKKDEELQGIMKRLNEAIASAPPASSADKPAGGSHSEIQEPVSPPAPPPLVSAPSAPLFPVAAAGGGGGEERGEISPQGGGPAPEDEKPDPDEPDTDMNLRTVDVVCFYPKGRKSEFANLRSKFNSMLRKHKLKFRLSRLAERSFEFEGKQDYGFFSKVCRDSKCSVALVLGPPPTPLLGEDDFASMLSSVLEEERIFLQFIPWSEIGKDYRYLNCALDISLLLPVK